jgi:hypothetical protein
MPIRVLSAEEYQAQEYDAVLVRDDVVVCLRPDEDLCRVVPLERVHHVDGDPDQFVENVPEDFHGGGEFGFVDAETFSRFD